MLATLSAVRIARQLLARVLRTFGITPPPHLEPAPDELLALESAGEDGEERQASWPLWLFFTVAIGGPYMMYDDPSRGSQKMHMLHKKRTIPQTREHIYYSGPSLENIVLVCVYFATAATSLELISHV